MVELLLDNWDGYVGHSRLQMYRLYACDQLLLSLDVSPQEEGVLDNQHSENEDEDLEDHECSLK